MGMTRDEALALLGGGREGIRKWNSWKSAREKVEGDRDYELLVAGVLGGKKVKLDTEAKRFDLRGARFSKTNLSEANLSYADLRGATMIGTICEDTQFSISLLIDANLVGAKFKNASFYGANLKGSKLFTARMEGADLRRTKGLRLNNTFIRNAQFSPAGFFPWSSDPWTQLRQSYTGPRLLFNLLMLFGFVVPLAAKVLFWFTVQQSSSSLEAASMPVREEVASLRQELEAYPGCKPAVAASQRLEKLVNNPNLAKCLGRECQERTVFSVLFGFDGHGGWWLPTFSVVMVAYNLLRGGMTWAVAGLRDNEERSGWSPSYNRAFQALIVGHYVTWSLGMLAAASFIVHAYTFLSSPISVPW